MIITKLIGGLGNQMFQYAAGRNAALANKTELLLDITNFPFEGSPRREYSLNIFTIKPKFASSAQINSLKTDANVLWVIKTFPTLSKLPGLSHKKSHVKEKQFDEKLLSIPDNSYMEGQWASEKYFEKIKAVIKRDFQPKESLSKEMQNFKKLIDNSNSVSLHIRRQDYVSSEKNLRMFTTLKRDYYQKAIRLINRNTVKPHYFVFTDDIKIVNNFRFPKQTTIVNKPPENKDYEHLFLMSYCKHNIIANSSFSWWGAWLNNHSQKIVIGPKYWFRDPTRNSSYLMPNSWQRI